MNALCFGEVLWDVIQGNEHLGGAPFNLAAHLTRNGLRSRIITRIGDDDRGRRVLTRMRELHVDTEFVQVDPERPTGTVTVELDAGGQPTFTIHEGVAWDAIQVPDALVSALRTAPPPDVFCFGTLAQRCAVSRASLRAVLEAVKAAQVFYDVNLRQSYYTWETIRNSLQAATIAKLNSDEAVVLSRALFGEDLPVAHFARRLLRDFDLTVAIVTQGGEGCEVYSSDDGVQLPGIPVAVSDAVGAGDAFGAGFLARYLEGDSLRGCAEFANRLGTYVASQPGAIPEYDGFAG